MDLLRMDPTYVFESAVVRLLEPAQRISGRVWQVPFAYGTVAGAARTCQKSCSSHRTARMINHTLWWYELDMVPV